METHELVALFSAGVIALMNLFLIVKIVRVGMGSTGGFEEGGFSINLQVGFFIFSLTIVPLSILTGQWGIILVSLIALFLSTAELILVIYFRGEVGQFARGYLLSGERVAAVKGSYDIGGSFAYPFGGLGGSEKTVAVEEYFEKSGADFDPVVCVGMLEQERSPDVNDRLQTFFREASESVKNLDGVREKARGLSEHIFGSKGIKTKVKKFWELELGEIYPGMTLKSERGGPYSVSFLYWGAAKAARISPSLVIAGERHLVGFPDERFFIDVCNGGELIGEKRFEQELGVKCTDAYYLRARESAALFSFYDAVWEYESGEKKRLSSAIFRASSLLAASEGGPERGVGLIKAIGGRGEVAPAEQVIGELFLSLGQNRDAAAKFKRAVEIDNRFIQGYQGMARTLAELGEFDLAEKWLDKALGIEPHNAPILNSMGILYLKEGKQELAERAFGDTIKSDRNFIVARENLAKALLSAGKQSEASKVIARVVRTYMHLIKRSPNSGYFRAGLERFLADIGHASASKLNE